MKPLTDDDIKVAQVLFENAFSHSLNMNDTFGYACADAGELGAYDRIKLTPIIAKYGDDALNAFEAVKRGYDPIPPRINENFKAAKAAILEAKAKDPLVLSPSWYPDTE